MLDVLGERRTLETNIAVTLMLVSMAALFLFTGNGFPALVCVSAWAGWDLTEMLKLMRDNRHDRYLTDDGELVYDDEKPKRENEE